MGSMCTSPHPIAKKAYNLYFESNLGDSGLFPASSQLEQEAIAQLGELLHGTQTSGLIVSGGTEANLLALTSAKNISKIDEPEVVLGKSAHFSFSKICRLLNIKPIYASLDSKFRIDPSKVDGLITKKTIAIVGTVGTSEFGAIDPIETLSQIAQKHHIPLHVDAAFGGLVVPFLDGVKQRFDFDLVGVQSITVDPHKMGFSAIPAGGILFRNQTQLETLKTQTPYITDSYQYSLVGTRSGASAASTWAVFSVLGRGGYRKIVAQCMENTLFLSKKLLKAGFNLVVEPTLNVVAFQDKNTKGLAEHLWRLGWFVSYNPRYDCIRIVLMPHIKKRHLTEFLAVLGTQKP
jgi:tyrosine decarboxylase/aspartate 1-decarboxylase